MKVICREKGCRWSKDDICTRNEIELVDRHCIWYAHKGHNLWTAAYKRIRPGVAIALISDDDGNEFWRYRNNGRSVDYQREDFDSIDELEHYARHFSTFKCG